MIALCFFPFSQQQPLVEGIEKDNGVSVKAAAAILLDIHAGTSHPSEFG